MKELPSTSRRWEAVTTGATIGAIVSTFIASYQKNIPADIFNSLVTVLIFAASNRELRGEAVSIGKLVINLLKPKIKS